jgi:hypothetical protein
MPDIGARSPPGRRGDVELEGVHQLVAEHVVGLGEPAAERHDDAPLEELGDAAGALTDVAGHGVGLAEVRGRRIQDERLATAELVVEHAREARVPALGHARGQWQRHLLFGVVVDVEVLRLEDTEVEPLVLHAVLPEVLGARGLDAAGQHEQDCGDQRSDGHELLVDARLTAA